MQYSYCWSLKGTAFKPHHRLIKGNIETVVPYSRYDRACDGNNTNIFDIKINEITKQYLDYMKNVAQFNLGPTFRYEGRTVNDLIKDGLPKTATIGFLATIFARNSVGFVIRF